MNISVPANVMNFFKIMIPMVMFDVLSDIPQFEEFVEQYEGPEQVNNIREQMVDLGYETHNPIIIMRTLIVLQLYYAMRIIILFGVLYPIKKFYANRF